MSCVSNALNDACSSAGELLTLLEQEQSVLKAFNSDQLLKLLPRKEFLTRRLSVCISEFKESDTENGGQERETRLQELRKTLKSITRLNELNRVFIAQSLGYWSQLMAVIDIPHYGPGHCRSGASSFSGKGFHLRREV